jgi:hypothetical protein
VEGKFSLNKTKNVLPSSHALQQKFLNIESQPLVPIKGGDFSTACNLTESKSLGSSSENLHF